MGFSNAIIEGRLVEDIEVKTTQGGTEVAKFSLAANKWNTAKKESEGHFFNLTAFGKQATFLAAHFKKGDPMFALCELNQNRYTDKDGNNRNSIECVVIRASFTGAAAYSTIEGRIATHEFELKETPNGNKRLVLNVAVNKWNSTKKENEGQFKRVVFFGATAEFVAKNFKKGDAITLLCEVSTRDYTDKNDVRRTITEHLALRVNFTEMKVKGEGDGTASAASGDYKPSYNKPSYDIDVDGFEEIDDDGDLPF